ncbi:MAG: WXG100 family type VII secretion target [Sciscionella sp.]
MIKVDFGQVAETAQQLTQLSQQVDQELEDLKGKIAQLAATWEGSASSDFQNTQNQWNQAARDLQQTQASIATAVHTAVENYQQTESANAKRWG